MPEPSALSRVVQIGPEVTAGTLVAATRKLSLISLEPSPAAEFQEIKPMGRRYPTATIMNRDWTTFGVSGGLAVNELPYILTSLFGKTTPTGTTPKTWTFTGVSGTVIDPQTYSIEISDGARAERFAHFMFTGLNISADRAGDVTIGGSAIGQNMALGATPTAALTKVDTLAPVASSHWDVYVDPTFGALGTTQLTKVTSFSYDWPDVWGAAWYLNRAKASFSGVVEQSTRPEITMTMAWDTTAEAFYTAVKANTTQFLRFRSEATYSSQTHIISIDMAVRGLGFEAFSDEDGIYAMGFRLAVIESSAWAKAQSISVVGLLDSV